VGIQAGPRSHAHGRSPRMSTLLVSENFPPRIGGSSRWFLEIYRRLPRDQFLIASGEALGQDEFDRTHDLRVIRMPLTLRSWGIGSIAGVRGYWSAIRRLWRLARAERVGMLHCGRCLPEGLMALGLKGLSRIPYACYVHGEEMKYAAGSRELRWLTLRVVRRAEFVIANSRNTRQILTGEWGLPESRIRVFHPGVDTGHFRPTGRDRDVRRRLGWGDRPVILTAGRLQRRKGHDQMILALDTIRSAIPEVLYAIVGDGEERAALEGQVARGGLGDHVQFLGALADDELVRCYQQCDLFVLPNRQVGRDIEGFGMVLLEAQACGKPVVAGASGGTAETMRIPETGRIVSCEGPHELAAVVVELLSDCERLARMGMAARQWVVERFDWAVLGREAEQLFRCGAHPAGTCPPPVPA
jgi:phosphatidyl-myo-inositol dimannoside synthase